MSCSQTSGSVAVAPVERDMNSPMRARYIGGARAAAMAGRCACLRNIVSDPPVVDSVDGAACGAVIRRPPPNGLLDHRGPAFGDLHRTLHAVSPQPRSSSHIISVLPLVKPLTLAAVFGLRTAGDFRLVGLFKRERQSPFARCDTFIFTPLCFALSAAFIWVALGLRS